MTRRPFTEFLYRVLLVAYPSDFRRTLGEEAAGAFGQLHRDEWREGGIKAVAGLWRRSVLQVIGYGLKERWERRQRSSRTNAGRPPTRQRDPFIYSLVSDIRYAIRSLTRTPIFSVTAIAIVALGIGATTTIYSVVDNVLLRPLPYPDPHELVTFTKGPASFPVPDFVDVRDRTSALASIAAMTNVTFDLTGDGAPEQLAGARATEEFLPIFGATAAMGRLLTPDDFEPGAPNVAVLSYGLWQRRWGRDPNIVGKTVTLSAEPFVVVGVLGREFESPQALQWEDVELWVPLDVTTPAWQHRRIFVLSTIGRLAPGVTLAAAQAEFDALARTLADEYPRGNRQSDGNPYYFPLVPLHQATVGAVTQTLYVLLGAVGLLLLIACANVANLFLARGTDREREMALRAALGASRTRVMRQLLAESVVLALAGGTVGTGLSLVGIRAFGLFNPGGIPRLSEVVVDWRVLAFTVALSMLTGVLFGIVPVFQSAKTDVTNALKEGAQGVTAGRHRAKLRNSLVVAEIGLALVLLVGAGLLFNSFLRLQRVDPGFDSDNTTIMSLRLGTYGVSISGRYGTPESRLRLADDLLERIRTMPGVEAAGAAVRMPFGLGRCCWGDAMAPDGGSEDSVPAWIHPVTYGMMEALGARLVAGRFPTAREMSAPTSTVSAGAPRRVAAVINHSLAERYWPSSDPIGRVLRTESQTLSIVGVVEDIKHFGLDTPKQFDAYVPHAEGAVFPMLDVAVRSSNDPSSLAAMLREAVWSIDPELPVNPPQTMNDRIAGSITAPRFYSVLLSTFAVVAFLLAASGIYGSMLYSVGQRHRELGIRLALGAQTNDLVRMVVGKGLLLTTIGVAIGLAGAFAASHILESFVFGVSTADPLTFVVASLLLATVALAACYLPARKAAAADPLEALKAE